MNQLKAYCGIDCEQCDAYRATVTDDPVLRKKTADLWSRLNNVVILPEQINCEGCRANGVKTLFCEKLCAIRKCAISRSVPSCSICCEAPHCDALSVIRNNTMPKVTTGDTKSM